MTTSVISTSNFTRKFAIPFMPVYLLSHFADILYFYALNSLSGIIKKANQSFIRDTVLHSYCLNVNGINFSLSYIMGVPTCCQTVYRNPFRKTERLR